MVIEIFAIGEDDSVNEDIYAMLKYKSRINWLGSSLSSANYLAAILLRLPDLVLVEFRQPAMDGLSVCREIQAKYPGTKLLGTGLFNQLVKMDQIMASGASDFFLKNGTQGEIIEAIRTVIKGDKCPLNFDITLLPENGKLKLTRREIEILELIAKGYTIDALCTKLFISKITAITHRRNILDKFGTTNIASLLCMATNMHFIKSVFASPIACHENLLQ